jgi:periplasmic divalent cation tolerance protein
MSTDSEQGVSPPLPDPELVLVLTTEADADRADALARALVEQGLAACVSQILVRSTYRWQGQLECAQEVQLLIKTTPEGWPALKRAILGLHSYDTPELLHWRVQASEAYGAWVTDAVTQVKPDFS